MKELYDRGGQITSANSRRFGFSIRARKKRKHHLHSQTSTEDDLFEGGPKCLDLFSFHERIHLLQEDFGNHVGDDTHLRLLHSEAGHFLCAHSQAARILDLLGVIAGDQVFVAENVRLLQLAGTPGPSTDTGNVHGDLMGLGESELLSENLKSALIQVLS